MVNETRPSRKSKEDEVVASKKKASDDSAAALRRSTRCQNNSSPNNVRKSQRIERRTPPNTPSSSVKKKKKKNAANPSPLRRSGRESKSISPSSKGSLSAKGSKQPNKVSNGPGSSKEKPDKTLKEMAAEVREHGKQTSSNEVGGKRKKRLDARHYRDMFKPLKKVKVSESESDVKSKPCNSEGSRESYSEKIEEEKNEHSDEEESKGDCANGVDHDDNNDDSGDGDGDTDGDDDVQGSDSVENSNVDVSKQCASEDGEGVHVSSDHNVPSPSSPRNKVAKESDSTDEVAANDSIKEKLSNQDMLSDSKKLSHDGNGLGCCHKEVNLGVSAIGKEAMPSCPTDDVLLVSSSKMRIWDEECAKCFRKRRLDHNSPPQELCCCLSNTANDIDDSKDRGQCGTSSTAEFAEEDGEHVKPSDSLIDVQLNICVTCKLSGKLLHCCGKGCRKSYHPSCSLNREENIYLSNWYCSDCTKKKLAFGVHSVSQGIEYILDAREVELVNSEDSQKQKQCFVKYRGLAHIHNCWVPEAQLLHEAPKLCVQLGMQKEDMQWNPDWAVPHRLLHRRSIFTDDHCDKPTDHEAGCVPNSQHEWLVKWCGLDYDQATWEFENSSFLKGPKPEWLIEEYKIRRNKAKRIPGSILSYEGQVLRKDSCHFNFIHRLRDLHHKKHNAILLDEQDRIFKVTNLVTSLATTISRPLLIITPHASMSSWEDEFVRLGASINVVVYGGNADARSIIRSLEFYDEAGEVIFHVLISTAVIVAEDVRELKVIEWEAVFIDGCQESRILAHSGCLKKMAIGWRLLLINAQLEDNACEYFNILSLVEPDGSFNQTSESVSNSDADLKVLRSRVSSFIICSSFLEYWVPVEVSNLQLENYCHTLLSNSSTLRSFLKNDPMGSLRDILISLRKCCDHPYIADVRLQASLAEGLSQDAMMDLGIKASGKLYFLEKLLSDFRNLELKVLILFQPTGGSGRDSTGYILEDFIRWRFGPESYEHVASGLIPSKKQTACNQFNTLTTRSFLLLEARACSPTIKISKLDAVIIFDSDWYPLNDLKALQKITVDSKLEQIKVFRLYCPCTIEEKVLILAKNEITLGSNLQNVLPSVSHMLLMWGSSYLFSRLDKFHHDNISDSMGNIVFESSILADVNKEIIYLFHKNKSINANKYISVARQNRAYYLKCIPLMGEKIIHQEDGVSPLDFWTKLLGGKQPHWKYFSGSSQRSRKRVQYNEAPLSEAHSDEALKRRKKMDTTKTDSYIQHAELCLENANSVNQENEESMANKDPKSIKNNAPTLSVMTNSIHRAPEIAEFGNLKILHDEQRGLIELLKPIILCLCEALEIEDDGKILAKKFLEYLVKNYRVTRKPETTLQAFLLSVCWTAAEEVNKIIDHKQSLLIARRELDFCCSECEAEDIYSKLKPKMEKYLFLGSKNSDLKGKFVKSAPGNAKNTTVELEESSLSEDRLKKQGLSLVHIENDFGKNMKKIERKCKNTMERFLDKQKEELEEFEKSWEKRRMKLQNSSQVKLAAIRVTHANSSVYMDKLRALNNDCAKEKEALEKEISIEREELKAKQKSERDEEQKKLAGLLERAKLLEQRKMLQESHAKNGVTAAVAEPIEPGNDLNGTVCINKNLSTHNSQREESRTPEAGRESIISVLPEHSENADKQRASSRDDSTNAPENILASNEASDSLLATEGPGNVDVTILKVSQCLSTRPATESVSDGSGMESPPEQPCVPGQVEKNADTMDDVAVDKSTSLTSNQVSKGSTPDPHPSPVNSATKQLTVDIGQGVEDESCDRIGERLPCSTGNCDALTVGEIPSSNFPDCVPSDLPSNEGTSGSADYSFDQWVRDSQNNDEIRVARELVNPPIGSHMSFGGNTTSMYPDQSGAGIIGEAILQPFPQSAVDLIVDANNAQNGNFASSARRAFPAHASHPNQVRMPVSSSSRGPATYSDPLQIELDRISRELNGYMNFHEQKKLQLKSECEKEIEEVITQIRSKYEKMLDEDERAFSAKKNELQIYHHKVMMNKSLAEAFRSKCTEYKAAPRMQQLGVPSSSVESASQSPSARPMSSAASFSAAHPAAGPTSSAPPVCGVRPSTMLSPPVRTSHIAPSAAQQQNARREVRTPAPHIQEFSSASQTISSSSLPSGSVLMTQQTNNPMSTSAPPLTPLPPPRTQSNHHGQPNQGTFGGTLLLSNTELLLDMTRQSGANLHHLSSNVSPLPENLRHSESQDLQCERATNSQSLSSSSLVAEDVVCLSDDE